MGDRMTLDLNRVQVIIPALNEAETIADVVQALQKQGLQRIRVVDNGSCDRTAGVAEAAGATVIHEPHQGYGQACWLGYQDLPDDITWILFCDGDGSDDLTQLPALWQAAATADFVLTNRRNTAAARANLTWVQNFGNGLATRLIQLGWGFRYQDLGPLRLIRRDALEQMQMCDRNFGWTVEMQVKAVEMGLQIREIPVGYRPRQGGRSKISGTLRGAFSAGRIILATIGSLYWSRWRRLENQAGSEGLAGLENSDRENSSLTRPQHSHPALIGISALLLLVGLGLMMPNGDFRELDAVPQFWVGAGVASLGFGLTTWIQQLPAWGFWITTLLSRLLLLPMYPGDDVWRYLWEGYIQRFGFSPYAQSPIDPSLNALRTPWWEFINSIDVSAVYPPITQLGFRILAGSDPEVITFKLAFVAADLIVCGLLARRFGFAKTLIYAWNPLVIYIFAGGAHYDSWFILPLVLAWLLAERRRWLASAVWIGISLAVKWVSWPILIFVATQVRWRVAIAVLGLGSLPMVLSAIPYCNLQSCALITNQSRFVLLARSADWIPYWVGKLWPGSVGHNAIFAIPLLVVVLMLLWKNWPQSRRSSPAPLLVIQEKFHPSFLNFAEPYLFGLLILSPVVHPWYLTWLVPFAVASRNWGTRLVSISGFIYFVLQYRQAQGDYTWMLTNPERLCLWMPLILGYGWTTLSQNSQSFFRAFSEKPLENHLR